MSWKAPAWSWSCCIFSLLSETKFKCSLSKARDFFSLCKNNDPRWWLQKIHKNWLKDCWSWLSRYERLFPSQQQFSSERHENTSYLMHCRGRWSRTHTEPTSTELCLVSSAGERRSCQRRRLMRMMAAPAHRSDLLLLCIACMSRNHAETFERESICLKASPFWSKRMQAI